MSAKVVDTMSVRFKKLTQDINKLVIRTLTTLAFYTTIKNTTHYLKKIFSKHRT